MRPCTTTSITDLRDDARAIVVELLTAVAPDAADGTVRIEDSTRLHEDLGLDSMDFLELTARLAARTGVPVPESDLCEFETVGRATDYVVAASRSAAS